MIIKLNIADEDALAIKNNTKRIYVRARIQDANDYENLKNGDTIEFFSNNLGIFYARVKEVNHYETLEELLTLEGTRYITSVNNEETIKNNGFYAIHIAYLYSANTVWEELYEKAKCIRNPRDVSGMISAGQVGAAILTNNHNIYTGVCIDTASTLGMCGERNAIANMITNGENEIIKLVCVDSEGNVGSPCGACREYLMQLSKNSKNIEILKNIEPKEIIKLEELIPDWWGYDRV